jgi:Zn finger protein HypA/HybF involved in hydrogenase expression
MTKQKHEFVCDSCKKPAIVNLQQNWQRYDITDEGDFKINKEWEGDTNEFYCEKCGEREGII